MKRWELHQRRRVCKKKMKEMENANEFFTKMKR